MDAMERRCQIIEILCDAKMHVKMRDLASRFNVSVRTIRTEALDLERRLKNEKEMSEKVAEYYNRFLGWSMEFGLATIERKRIIISQLYKRIELGRGYVVNFEVDWNYEQFIDALQMEKHKGMTEVGIPMPPKVKKRVTKNINRKSDGAA